MFLCAMYSSYNYYSDCVAIWFECGDYLRVASDQRNAVVTCIHNGSIFTFSAKAKKQF